MLCLVSQSTLGDIRGRDEPADRDRPHLAPADYQRAFKLLEHASAASCLSEFKANVVEGLGSVFGFEHVSFFAGPTFQTVFTDRSPILGGHTSKMFPEYEDRWARHDIFGSPAAFRMLAASGVSSINELAAIGHLPLTATSYVRYFVVDHSRMDSAAAIQIDLFGMHTALVGIFVDEGHQLSARDLATLRLLSKQLSAIARGIPFVPARRDFCDLTDRQREVIHLIAEGFSNAQIALILTLAEDSVKKYVSRILASTGCSTRMELALLARSAPGSVGRPAQTRTVTSYVSPRT